MVSKARDDLPEPLIPVKTTNRLRGISRSIFLRLFSLAPFIMILSMDTPIVGLLSDRFYHRFEESATVTPAPKYVKRYNQNSFYNPISSSSEKHGKPSLSLICRFTKVKRKVASSATSPMYIKSTVVSTTACWSSCSTRTCVAVSQTG